MNPQQLHQHQLLQQQRAQLVAQQQQQQQQSQATLYNQPATVLCTFGVEWVQEIVSRFMELIQFLRTNAHPFSINNSSM